QGRGGEADGVHRSACRAGVETGDEVDRGQAAVQDIRAVEGSGVHGVGELLAERGERGVDVADVGARIGRLRQRGMNGVDGRYDRVDRRGGGRQDRLPLRQRVVG